MVKSKVNHDTSSKIDPNRIENHTWCVIQPLDWPMLIGVISPSFLSPSGSTSRNSCTKRRERSMPAALHSTTSSGVRIAATMGFPRCFSPGFTTQKYDESSSIDPFSSIFQIALSVDPLAAPAPPVHHALAGCPQHHRSKWSHWPTTWGHRRTSSFLRQKLLLTKGWNMLESILVYFCSCLTGHITSLGILKETWHNAAFRFQKLNNCTVKTPVVMPWLLANKCRINFSNFGSDSWKQRQSSDEFWSFDSGQVMSQFFFVSVIGTTMRSKTTCASRWSAAWVHSTRVWWHFCSVFSSTCFCCFLSFFAIFQGQSISSIEIHGYSGRFSHQHTVTLSRPGDDTDQWTFGSIHFHLALLLAPRILQGGSCKSSDNRNHKKQNKHTFH